LKELSFLGIEVNKDDFRYVYDLTDFKKYEIIAKRYREQNSIEERFRINNPFHSCLELINK
jgi:predicted nucleotidyltransferase